MDVTKSTYRCRLNTFIIACLRTCQHHGVVATLTNPAAPLQVDDAVHDFGQASREAIMRILGGRLAVSVMIWMVWSIVYAARAR